MENRIDEILKSGEQLPKLSVSDQLLNRLTQIPSQVSSQIRTLPRSVKWMLVAGIASIVVLNTLIMLYYRNNSGSSGELSNMYFSYLNQL